MRPWTAPALLFLLAFPGCEGPMPGLPGDEDPPPLREYRDSALGLDMGYPEGWTFTEKRETTASGRIVTLSFEALQAQWTRRFTVRLQIPDRPDARRTLEDFRDEYRERLVLRSASVKMEDTAWTVLSGHRAYQARYAVLMDREEFTRHLDFLSLPGGHDVSLSCEVDARHQGSDIVIFRAVADRFRYTPR